MTDLQTIKTDELEMNDAPALMWISVQEAVKLLWSENPKLHNIGDVVNSIVKYGFQELPKYDSNLPNVSGGTGAIKAGNGRIESLAWMEQGGEYELPRGLAKIKESDVWSMPLLIGTDAESLDMARAYAIDSNNLTLGGGDFTAIDAMRLWDRENYLRLLKNLATKKELPQSVDGDDLDFLMFVSQFNPMEDVFNLDVDETLKDEVMQISVMMPPKNFEKVVVAVRQLLEANPEWRALIK